MTEARFRHHIKRVSAEETKSLTHMDDILIRLTQQDIVNRRSLDPDHRSFVADRSVYIEADGTGD